MATYPYLLSRTLDPVFAVFIGTSAYYTFEQRVGRQPGHTLNELVAKRYRQWSQGAGGAASATAKK